MTAKWIVFLLMAAMSVPGWGQSPSQVRFALTPGQVARALTDGGMQTTDTQVSLLARVVATENSPALDVLSVEPLGKQPPAEHSPSRSRVKLACHLRGKCLPFYAIVSRSGPMAGSGADTAANTASAARASSSTFSGAGNPALKANFDITMRAGAHATLVMDDNRSHIQVAVVSLENGIAGHRIRVTSPDHKHAYVGEVVNAKLLRGSF